MTEPKAAIPEHADRKQATVWFARQRMHPLSESEAVEFEAWLKADPAHTHAWSECERLWTRVEDVRDDPQILAIREQARRRAGERINTQHRWGVAGALAASLILGVAVWWGVRVPT